MVSMFYTPTPALSCTGSSNTTNGCVTTGPTNLLGTSCVAGTPNC